MNTLANFLPQHLQQNALPAELGSVLESIIAACVQINGKIRLGALSGVLGMAGTGNIQGEDQKKLDVIANEILIETEPECCRIGQRRRRYFRLNR